MKIKVIDDFLPENIAELYSGYFRSIPHIVSEYPTESHEHIMDSKYYHFVSELDLGNYFNKVLCDTMYNSVSEFTGVNPEETTLYRFHTNMQFMGIGGGDYHHDGNSCTALYMCSHTEPEAGFEYIDGDDKFIEFKFNRLIMFNEPEMKHRGISPKTNTDGPRITVALKVDFLNKTNN